MTATTTTGKPPSAPAPAPSASGEASGVPAGEALLCEVAWEVCQQLGGIYTVLRSKAPAMVERWGERYVLVGPYNPETSPTEFDPAAPTGPVGRAVEALRQEGLEAQTGTWLVTGRPRAVLLDTRSVRDRLAEIKYALWDEHHISLPGGDDLLDEVVAFGYLVERFLRALAREVPGEQRIVAHFHEWMAGTALPALRLSGLAIGTVFTTHATQVGRSMAAGDARFYDHLPDLDGEEAARQTGVGPKAALERAAAHAAGVFTTLSEITAYECEHLLGRRPDLLVPNGLNIERFTAMHEFQNLHQAFKEKIHRFVMAHFFPSYTFDLDTTLYVFSAGRYEPRNKGYDLVVRAMARVNSELKRRGTERTVVLFLVTQRPCRSIHAEVLRNRAVMEEMRSHCDAIKNQFGERLFEATARGERPDFRALVDDTVVLRLRRVAHAWKSDRLPAIATHDLADENGDALLHLMHESMLFNLADDPVKVVYHPDFITSSNPLFGMDYEQFVRGCHLGLFPSWYEPWGYTPMECVALGVPPVTSDLSGFGTYVEEHVADWADRGLCILRRRRASDEEALEALVRYVLDFLETDRRGRIAMRNRVESLAGRFDWANLVEHYDAAHRLALERVQG
ncbi:MAG: glycosyltransferase [Phycisphaerae bacterium]